MTSTHNDPVIVVLQLTGGNDYFNTVIPYNDPLYTDNRPYVNYPLEELIRVDDEVAFSPTMGPIKKLYDQGKVAVINGIGYPRPNRSHFRSMDIWHTCEPDKIAHEGWLGRVIRDLDPHAENVLTGVNFGRGLPRALALTGVPVASVAVLETYGVLTGIADQQHRSEALDVVARMYAPVTGTGAVMDYMGRTGLDALKGADVLKTAPGKYHSSVEYADNPIAQNLKGIAQVMFADLGTRILYTQHGNYDTHANEGPTHPRLVGELSRGIADFQADLQEHGVADNVLMLVFTEFGRRVKDNGSGTDHGSGGVAFMIGDPVKGGMYGEYPSLKNEDLLEGDLHFNYDFRGAYSSIVDGWLGLDPVPVVGGKFEQLNFL